MAFFDKRVSAATLLQILNNFDDHTGYFEITTICAEPGGITKEYVSTVPIVFSFEERGTLQSGWPRIMMLKGDDRTFAEYPESDRIETWNQNYRALAKDIQ